MPRNPSFCYFESFWNFCYYLFINKPDSPRDLIFFTTSSISSSEIIKVVITDPKIFFWIAVSFADADVNPYVIKTLLTNRLDTFFIKDKPVLSNSPKSLPKTPPDFSI